VEGQNLGKSSQEKLLAATKLFTLLALPIEDIVGLGGGNNRLRNRLLGLRGNNRKLNHRVSLSIRIRAVLALQPILNLESEQLIKKRDLVAKELEELVGVTDSLAGRHKRRIDTRVEVLESHGSGGVPDVVETDFDRVCFIVLSIVEALL